MNLLDCTPTYAFRQIVSRQKVATGFLTETNNQNQFIGVHIFYSNFSLVSLPSSLKQIRHSIF